MRILLIQFWILIAFTVASNAQSYLHADGKSLKNREGENVILRGIGTGNWMLQEGYMMQSSDVAGTQHEFREKLVETMGEARTDSFYNAWLAWHFTRADVDSMKAWGFNTIRAALHYKWFTPPIEEEPISGEVTWIDRGFELMDSLLAWCEANEMYLFLDMHGAPGGQGYDAAISDYDDTKPSLWESQENKDKLIALWKKLAERYASEEWIGGYELINEPNWELGDNSPLWDLYIEITDSIRTVDTNHIIVIEGNWFANDYTGVPAPWDDNLLYSFHKYHTFNVQSSIQWMLDISNTYSVPLWLGETGENSNTWFTNIIALCESLNIGWSMWPVKKSGINNIMRVITNEEYTQLLDSWRGGPAMSAEDAFDAVLNFAENHKIENCTIQYDVIDAMIRQPHTKEILPFAENRIGEPVFTSNYDLGRNGFAYFDIDTANYQNSGLPYVAWNQGWGYRNDGVDMEECEDTDANAGYNVGWTADGEWLTYSLSTDSLAAYNLQIRHTSGAGGSIVRFESDGIPVTPNITLPVTGGWQNWETVVVDSIILPPGSQQLKLVFLQGGSNLNYFRFTDPIESNTVSFKALNAFTSVDGRDIYLFLNRGISSAEEELALNEFFLTSNDSEVILDNLTIDPINAQVLIIHLQDSVYYGDELSLSYSGTSVESSTGPLSQFSNLDVVNQLPVRYTIPTRIQAEDFDVNNGFSLESCEDNGGGFNTAYANSGDYLEYRVYVPEVRHYLVRYRVATTWSNAQLIFMANSSGSFEALDTIQFSSTGGWQNWTTQSSPLYLEAGRYNIRLYVKQGEHNLNWFDFQNYSNLPSIVNKEEIGVYPNPGRDIFNLIIPDNGISVKQIRVYDVSGLLLLERSAESLDKISLNLSGLNPGSYILQVSDETQQYRPVRIVRSFD